MSEKAKIDQATQARTNFPRPISQSSDEAEVVVISSPASAQIGLIDIVESGDVKKKVIREGLKGYTPFEGAFCTIAYEARLLDGSLVGSSREDGQSLRFVLGRGTVNAALDKCVRTMNFQEKCVMTTTASHAYGPQGSPPRVPPNASIVYEIDLYAWATDGKIMKKASPELRASEATRLKESGNFLFKKKMHTHAVVQYRNALQCFHTEPNVPLPQSSWSLLNPIRSTIQLNLCVVYQALQRFDQVVFFASKVVHGDRNNVKAIYCLANALTSLHRYDEARAQTDIGLTLAPDHKDLISMKSKIDQSEKTYIKNEQSMRGFLNNMKEPLYEDNWDAYDDGMDRVSIDDKLLGGIINDEGKIPKGLKAKLVSQRPLSPAVAAAHQPLEHS